MLYVRDLFDIDHNAQVGARYNVVFTFTSVLEERPPSFRGSPKRILQVAKAEMDRGNYHQCVYSLTRNLLRLVQARA